MSITNGNALYKDHNTITHIHTRQPNPVSITLNLLRFSLSYTMTRQANKLTPATCTPQFKNKTLHFDRYQTGNTFETECDVLKQEGFVAFHNVRCNMKRYVCKLFWNGLKYKQHTQLLYSEKVSISILEHTHSFCNELHVKDGSFPKLESLFFIEHSIP